MGIKRALGSLAWKVVGTRSVVGTAEVRLRRDDGASHTLIGSKLDFTRKSLPVSKVLRAAGMRACGPEGNDGACTCAATDKVRVQSTDLYGTSGCGRGTSPT